jgi:hypothetical protein
MAQGISEEDNREISSGEYSTDVEGNRKLSLEIHKRIYDNIVRAVAKHFNLNENFMETNLPKDSYASNWVFYFFKKLTTLSYTEIAGMFDRKRSDIEMAFDNSVLAQRSDLMALRDYRDILKNIGNESARLSS